MSMHWSALQALAGVRAHEAQELLKVKCPSGAYYLCGYAIEAALKAVIAQNFEAATIPDKKFVNDIYTHRIETLVRLAGLDASLQERLEASSLFEENWTIVRGWSEAKRYEIIGLDVADRLVRAALDENDGVLNWIKSKW